MPEGGYETPDDGVCGWILGDDSMFTIESDFVVCKSDPGDNGCWEGITPDKYGRDDGGDPTKGGVVTDEPSLTTETVFILIGNKVVDNITGNGGIA